MVDKESLERIFQNSVKWWRDHHKETEFSSNPQDYLDCDAYRSLAVIGKLDKIVEITIPLLRRVISKASATTRAGRSAARFWAKKPPDDASPRYYSTARLYGR